MSTSPLLGPRTARHPARPSPYLAGPPIPRVTRAGFDPRAPARGTTASVHPRSARTKAHPRPPPSRRVRLRPAPGAPRAGAHQCSAHHNTHTLTSLDTPLPLPAGEWHAAATTRLWSRPHREPPDRTSTHRGTRLTATSPSPSADPRPSRKPTTYSATGSWPATLPMELHHPDPATEVVFRPPPRHVVRPLPRHSVQGLPRHVPTPSLPVRLHPVARTNAGSADPTRSATPGPAGPPAWSSPHTTNPVTPPTVPACQDRPSCPAGHVGHHLRPPPLRHAHGHDSRCSPAAAAALRRHSRTAHVQRTASPPGPGPHQQALRDAVAHRHHTRTLQHRCGAHGRLAPTYSAPNGRRHLGAAPPEPVRFPFAGPRPPQPSSTPGRARLRPPRRAVTDLWLHSLGRRRRAQPSPLNTLPLPNRRRRTAHIHQMAHGAIVVFLARLVIDDPQLPLVAITLWRACRSVRTAGTQSYQLVASATGLEPGSGS